MYSYKIPFKLKGFLNCFKRYGIFIHRHNHNKTDFCIEKLNNRKVVRISGDGSSDFLQGLITNDIDNCSSSIYTLFLNHKGRVLFDSIIYRTKEKNTFFLECDSEAINQFVKHLKVYKLRRNVDISSGGSELNVWCIYNPKAVDTVVNQKNINGVKHFVKEFQTNTIENESIVISPDPRTTLLGYRLITRGEEHRTELPNGDLYQVCRYKLGIGEGIDEFLVGQSFPLEMNCDYLQGVSFNKGCYIGQELTARTFHTGVTRKRLMPLFFDTEPLGIPMNTPIEDLTHPRKSPIGKLRAAKGVNGLGLMRVSETMESKSLKILSNNATSYVPVWWPEETVKQTYVKKKIDIY